MTHAAPNHTSIHTMLAIYICTSTYAHRFDQTTLPILSTRWHAQSAALRLVVLSLSRVGKGRTLVCNQSSMYVLNPYFSMSCAIHKGDTD